jgi:acyl carrier protein
MTHKIESSEPASTMSATDQFASEAAYEIIAECLGIETVEVKPSARFFEDLGGESIDLLELSFQFEKAFQIKAPFKDFSNKELWERDESGQLTNASKELIQRDFPYLDIEQRVAVAESSDPRNLLTIEMMVLMLRNAKSESEVQ